MSGMLKKLCAGLGALIMAASMASPVLADRYEVLQEGDTDGSVYTLQESLNDLGYLKCGPTGYFGSLTVSAVKAYQNACGLLADGKAGPKTLSHLLGSKYSGVKYTGNMSRDTFSRGDNDLAVGDIQRRLMELGYIELECFTSSYGAITEDGIRRFQRANNLTVDGVCGPKTLSRLFSNSGSGYTLRREDRGSDVTKLQKRLKELGYLSAEATGYYGSLTEAAVKAFQKANGLTADGITGPKTMDKVYSSSAKGASAEVKAQVTEKMVKNENDSGSSKVDSMIDRAKAKLGCSYVWSTEGPNTFDCSGFVYYILKNSGVKVGRLNAAGFSQNSDWTKISSVSDLRKGDLVFFHPTGSSRISHTGIYIGSGKFIHASSGRGEVVISDITSDYYRSHFSVARRPQY